MSSIPFFVLQRLQQKTLEAWYSVNTNTAAVEGPYPSRQTAISGTRSLYQATGAPWVAVKLRLTPFGIAED